MAYPTDHLRQATAASHKRLESSIFAKTLVSGMIPERLWSNYLLSKYMSSVVIELRMPILDELGISRRRLLSDDLSYAMRGTASKATIKYVDRLASTDLSKLPAHVYVGYLGDLFGGQLMAKNSTWPSSHLDRDNREFLIDRIRGLVCNDQENLIEEANVAFEMIRDIYDELL